MKVVLLSTFHPYRGGISQFNASLYRALESQGHEPTAFNFTRQYPSILFPGKTQYVADGDSADAIPNQRILDAINPISWIRAAREINREQADMVILPFWTPFHGPALGGVAKRLNAKKIVGLVHNLIPHEARFTDKALTMRYLRHLDEVWVLSEAVKEQVLSLRSDIPVKIHPHPLYTHFEERLPKKSATEKLGLDPTIPVFLFFGLVRPYKGLDTLIKAFQHLDQPAQLVVAGEAYEDYTKYTALASDLGISSKVQFHNRYIDDHEIPTFFGAADAVVLPYRRASQSGVTAIALNYELPIIASNVGGLSEYIKNDETGLLAAPGSPEDLAKMMNVFLSNPSKFKSPNTFATLKSQLSWDHFLHVLLEV